MVIHSFPISDSLRDWWSSDGRLPRTRRRVHGRAQEEVVERSRSKVKVTAPNSHHIMKSTLKKKEQTSSVHEDVIILVRYFPGLRPQVSHERRERDEKSKRTSSSWAQSFLNLPRRFPLISKTHERWESEQNM